MGELYYLPFYHHWNSSVLVNSAALSRQWIFSSIHVLMQAGGTLIFSNQGLCWHIASAALLLLFHSPCESKWRQNTVGQRRYYVLVLHTSTIHAVETERTGCQKTQPPNYVSLVVIIVAYSIQNQHDQCNAHLMPTNECLNVPRILFTDKERDCNIFETQGTVFWFYKPKTLFIFYWSSSSVLLIECSCVGWEIAQKVCGTELAWTSGCGERQRLLIF